MNKEAFPFIAANEEKVEFVAVSHDTHNEDTNIYRAFAGQRGSEQASTAEEMGNDDGLVLREGALTQAKFFLRKLMSPLVEESWE